MLITIVQLDLIVLSRSLVCLGSRSEALYLLLGQRDTPGILLVYSPPAT